MGLAKSAALVALLCVACGTKQAAPPTRTSEQGPALAAFELRNVVAPKLAAIRARIAAESSPQTASGDSPEDLREQAFGLISFLNNAEAAMADAAFEDAARLGDPVVPHLLALFNETASSALDRRAALRLIGEIKTPLAANALAEIAGRHRDASFRAVASWKLATMDQDLAVLALLRQLRYEKDSEALPWLVRTLVAHGNFAGIEALTVQALRDGPDSPASSHLSQMVAEANPETPFDNAYDLAAAWDAGDPDQHLPLTAPRSASFDLAVWTWIEVLAEFQLRGVDDSRYILSSLGPEYAPKIAAALHDSNRYIRSHVAQSLGRMGPRGIAAAPQLAAAIADPILAPYAAEALASVCQISRAQTDGQDVPKPPVTDVKPLPILVACTANSQDPGLRLAATRALGVLGDPAAAKRLDALADPATPTNFPELRQAATESLVALGHGTRVAAELVAFARHEDLDSGTSLRALRNWIAIEAGAQTAHFRELLVAWDALNPNEFIPPTAAENTQRNADRLALVEELLARDSAE